MYPSEQQYYNAIKRKGYKASATDMPSTLAIHNAVNEKGWEMVKEWERERAVGKASPSSLGAGGGSGSSSGGGEGDDIEIKLLRFTGRPQDMSPKAWINTYLLGYRPPFDRCGVLFPTVHEFPGGGGGGLWLERGVLARFVGPVAISRA